MKQTKTNKITHLIALTIIFLLPSLAAVPGTGTAAPGLTTELQAQLQLNDEQASEVERIFKMAQSQAELDRENFKGNALALIEAAKRRRDMSDSLCEALLNPGQKELFLAYKEKRKQEDGFFILKEGLILTEEQSWQVKNILDEYRRQFEADRQKLAAEITDGYDQMDSGLGMPGEMPYGMPYGTPYVMPGGVPGGMPGGLSGERRGSQGLMRGGNMKYRLLDALQELENKTAKKIKPLLTKEQDKMYEDIRKMQQAELKRRIEAQPDTMTE
jgi:hypothetical protein